MGAEHAAKRRMQQVRSAMVLPQLLPAFGVHLDHHVLAFVKAAGGDSNAMHYEPCGTVVGVEQLAPTVGAGHHACITHLTTRLCIRRGPAENDLDGVSGDGVIDATVPGPLFAGYDPDTTGRDERVVSNEINRAALARERRIEVGGIDRGRLRG